MGVGGAGSGQQLVDATGGMSGDAGQHVGQPGLGIDVVELGGDDEAVEEGGTLAAAVGAGEQPCLSAESQPTQGALGGIVAEADAAVVEGTGDGVPARPPLGSDARVLVWGSR